MWIDRNVENQGVWRGIVAVLEPCFLLKAGVVRDQNLGLVNFECLQGNGFPSCSGHLFLFFTIFMVKFFPCTMFPLVSVAAVHLWEGLALVFFLSSGGCRPAVGSALHFSGSEQPQVSVCPLVPATLAALWWTCLSFSVVFLSLKSPELDTTLQRRSRKCYMEEENHSLCSAGFTGE